MTIPSGTIGLLRALDYRRAWLRARARPMIRRESNAYYHFEALDEVPDGWPSEWEGCEDYSWRGALQVLREARKAGVQGLDEYNGPYRNHDSDGEFVRFCPVTGAPLPWSLLEGGMQSELDHFESEFFWTNIANRRLDSDWYSLWRVCDEACGRDAYLSDYGQRIFELGWQLEAWQQLTLALASAPRKDRRSLRSKIQALSLAAPALLAGKRNQQTALSHGVVVAGAVPSKRDTSPSSLSPSVPSSLNAGVSS
jgi:hypothetical protein